MQRQRLLRWYIAAVTLASGAAVAAALLVEPRVERLWLAPVVAALIALSHVGEKRILRTGEQRETFSHDETYVVLLALLASPLVAVVAFAGGFALGHVISRRPPIKGVFNVATMTMSAALALLAFEAVAPSERATPGAAAAALGAALVFFVVNRLLLAGVFTIAGGGGYRALLLDDLAPVVTITAADASLGLLAAFAALEHPWTLPLALAALTAVHYALYGHATARSDRQKLSNIVNSSSDGIVSVDRDGRVGAWSPATEKLTGLAAAEAVGRPLHDVAAELDIADDLDAAADERSRGSTVNARTRSGERRWIGIRKTPSPDGGFVLLLHDETERRAREALRARAESEQLRADLVAAVSHELRTPLASILGFTATLLAHRHDEEQRRRFLEIVHEQGERLRALIDDLLDLRTIAAQGVRGHDLVDLCELVEEQVAEFAPQAPQHEVRARLDSCPLVVRGDRARLRQVLANLITNAIKYSPDGGVVEVATAHANGDARVSISDEGLGIPADKRAFVFDRFFRIVDPARADIAGTGLGLALAQEIVQAHGGTIDFESVEGSGSRFWFDLPLVEPLDPVA